MNKPRSKSAKKTMQGPMKFVKNQSKRKSAPRKKTIERFAKKPKASKESILKSIRDNKKVAAQKVTGRRTTFASTLAPGLERLEKYMAHAGLASRREAKDLIASGQVTVNGKVARQPGQGITVGKDVVELKGDKKPKETVLFYKPRGVETSKTTPEATDIHDKFPKFNHLAPVGRLDKDSEGLILLSNDGVLARLITGEKSTIEKEYRVSTREDVMPAMLARMEQGIKLEDGMTQPCTTKKTGRNEFTIVLKEGRKHQVRRMANACKLTVKRLVRIRIGDLIIGKMTAGNFKRLPDDLITNLKNGAK